jgi:HTH-type transcriptional regulator / antitoxin HigA
MSAALANAVTHVIRSDDELEQYTERLLKLSSKAHPTRSEQCLIELLTLLIEHYEEEHYAIPDASPLEVLHFLMEQNGLKQRDLITELGSEANVSLILSGKRSLTREHIAKLSRRFHVSPSVFF